MHRQRTVIASGLLGAVVIVAVAGCTSTARSHDAADGRVAPAGTAAGEQAKDSSTGLDAGFSAPPAHVIAARQTSAGNVSVEVTITQLRRSGDLLALDFLAKNTTPRSVDIDARGWQVGSFFDDGDTNATTGNATTGNPSLGLDTVDGIALVDSTNRKRHPAARDTERRCLCSANLSGTFVEPGQAVTLSAIFAAPPANVTTMDVMIPHVGTFADVPIS